MRYASLPSEPGQSHFREEITRRGHTRSVCDVRVVRGRSLVCTTRGLTRRSKPLLGRLTIHSCSVREVACMACFFAVRAGQRRFRQEMDGRTRCVFDFQTGQLLLLVCTTTRGLIRCSVGQEGVQDVADWQSRLQALPGSRHFCHWQLSDAERGSVRPLVLWPIANSPDSGGRGGIHK